MPSNSSSKLKTMSGFQSMIPRRSSDKLSESPKGRTSCPAAFRCGMTSYSVRHSSISFSVAPTRESGGTRVECTSTSVRSFFIAASSQRDVRQLPLFVGLRQPRDHPDQLCLEFAPRAAHVEIQALAPVDHQPQNLMHEILAQRSPPHALLSQAVAQLPRP